MEKTPKPGQARPGPGRGVDPRHFRVTGSQSPAAIHLAAFLRQGTLEARQARGASRTDHLWLPVGSPQFNGGAGGSWRNGRACPRGNVGCPYQTLYLAYDSIRSGVRSRSAQWRRESLETRERIQGVLSFPKLSQA
jgi:hypothetical protein